MTGDCQSVNRGIARIRGIIETLESDAFRRLTGSLAGTYSARRQCLLDDMQRPFKEAPNDTT